MQLAISRWWRSRASVAEQPLQKQRRRSVPVNLYRIEALEGRTLLAGDLIAGSGFTLYPGIDGGAFPGFTPIPSGYETRIEGVVDRAASNNLNDAKANTPEGSLVVEWYGGPVLAVLPVTAVPTPNDPSGYAGYSEVGIQTVTLNPANAGIPITQGQYAGDYLLYAYFTGGGGYAPTPRFSDSDYALAQQGSVLNAYHIEFTDGPQTGPEDHIAFQQSPDDNVLGEPLDPAITVAVFDAEGKTVTSSNSLITLTLTGGDETATLGGTTGVNAIDGIATFSNVTIDKPGEYQLIASSSGGSTPIFSSPFDISAGKLVFKTPPKAGDAGDPLKPIVVEIRDGDGNVVTDDNETVITLDPIGFNGDAPIEGNVATVVNGVATFDSVVLKRPGSYQLQASDGSSTVATSKKFKVSGGKLALTLQPTTSDVNAPLDIKVVVKTAKGKLDTDSTSFAQLTLNPVDPASTATLGGTFVVPFIGGIATFGGEAGPFIDAPGKYTFTVTEVVDSLGSYINAETSTPIDTKQFQVGGYKLTFQKPPVATDVNKRLEFAVAQVDPKKKVNKKLNAHHVQLTLTPVIAGVDGVLSDFTNVGFVAGVQTFSGDQSPFINIPGTYTLTATEVDANNVPIATTEPVTSKPFKVSGFHVIFQQQPKTGTAGKPQPFKVAIANSKNKVDTTQNTARINIMAAPDAGVEFTVSTFANGVLEFAEDKGTGTSLILRKIGTFKITISAEIPGQPASLIEPITSKAFKMTGQRLIFLDLPKIATVNDTIPMRIAVVDSKGKIDVDQDTAELVLSADASADLEFERITFTDGVAEYPKARLDAFNNYTNIAAIHALGSFPITATAMFGEVAATTIDAITSKPIKVLPMRLSFTIPPVTIGGGFPIPPFQIALINIDGDVMTGEFVRVLDVTYRATSGPNKGVETPLTTATIEGGTTVDLNLLYINEPGKYVLISTDTATDGHASPVTSKVFSILE